MNLMAEATRDKENKDNFFDLELNTFYETNFSPFISEEPKVKIWGDAEKKIEIYISNAPKEPSDCTEMKYISPKSNIQGIEELRKAGKIDETFSEVWHTDNMPSYLYFKSSHDDVRVQISGFSVECSGVEKNAANN